MLRVSHSGQNWKRRAIVEQKPTIHAAGGSCRDEQQHCIVFRLHILWFNAVHVYMNNMLNNILILLCKSSNGYIVILLI